MNNTINPKVYQLPPTITDRGVIEQAELELEQKGPSLLYFIRRKENVFHRNQWAMIFFVDEEIVVCRDLVPVRVLKDLDTLRNYILSLTGCELVIINPLKSLNP
jgi:hypothetical protein